MEFLEDNPEVKLEAERLLAKFENQVEKLRKTDVESYRSKIEKAPDIESKSRYMRHLLETNVPACVDLLDRLLLKHKTDRLQYLEWLWYRVKVAMSLESFNRARTFAERAHALSKDLYNSTDSVLPRKLTYKAYVKACINLLLVCRYQGKIADAQVYLEEAQSASAAEEDEDDQDELLILHGDLLLARTQLVKAIDEVFTPLLRKPGLSLHNRGLLLQKLGNACRSAARWGDAKDYLRESIEIAQDLEDSVSVFDRVTDLGNVYRSEGRIADALEQQVEHMGYAFNRGDLWGLTVACFNMGFAYYSITPNPDLKRALLLLSLKHELAARTENEPLRGMALNNLGKTFCALSQFEPALKVMFQSAEIAQKTLNVGGEGMAYGNIGTAYRSIGKYNEAIEYHRKYLLNASSRGDDGGAAIMLRELTIDYLCKGDLENAEKQVREAISTLETIRDKLGGEDASKIANFDKNQAETYSLLQVILSRRGKHSEALALSELARSRALTDIIRDRLIKASGVPTTETPSWIYESDFVSRWQDLGEDIVSDYLKSADELHTNFLIYSVLKDYEPDGSIVQWLYIWVVLNEKAAKGRKRIQFKRVALNESIKDELLSDTGFFSSLTRSFRILSGEEKTVSSRLKKESSETKSDIPEEKVFVKLPENPDVEEFLSLLRSLSLTKISNQPTSLAKEDAEDKTPMRDYVHQSEDLKDQAHNAEDLNDHVNDAEDLNDQANEAEDLNDQANEAEDLNDQANDAEDSQSQRAELVRVVERGSWDEEGFKQLLKLYEVCIAPVDYCLPHDDGDEAPSITIIPHEFLFSVPFCCLHGADKKFLVERYVLSYSPSLRALLLLNQRLRYLKDQQGNRKPKILAMGDPVIVIPGVRPLPCSGDEAKNVQQVFGSEICQIALRFDATKRRFLQELQNIDMLHLATHAYPQDPELAKTKPEGDYSMRGCLFLASSDDECEGEVLASEIASRNCTCQLVMLSCCETGLGKLTGDGVVGLYRAFFAAGAASVIVTLWKIRDDVTPLFMDKFYNKFKETGNVSRSLRSAMLFCIREKKLPPQQWAAFSLIGAYS